MIHFQLIFLCDEIQLHSFAHGYQQVQHLIITAALLKSVDHKQFYIWILNSSQPIYMSFLRLIPLCLDCCSFVLHFKIEKYDSSYFVLSFLRLLAHSWSLEFVCILELVNFYKKLAGIFKRITLKL